MSESNKLPPRKSLFVHVCFPGWHRLIAGLFLGLFATVACSANWFFQPLVTLGTGYEQNAQLDEDEDEQIDSFMYEVAGRLRGGRLTERWQLVGNLGASIERYPGNEDLDTDNLSASLGNSLLPTEVDRFNLDLGFDRDTTRRSELTTTGDIRENVPRDVIRARGAWRRQLTQRSMLDLGYTHTRTRYDSNNSGFTDSDEDDVDASYTYLLSERLSLRGALGATWYDPDTVDPDAVEKYEGYDISVGVGYAFSERLTADMDVGWQTIESVSEVNGEDEKKDVDGLLLAISVNKEFDRSNVLVSLRKDRVPTGSGNLLSQESLALAYRYDLSPRASVTLPVAVFQSETLSLGGIEEDVKRTYFTAEPRLNYRLTEDLLLTASYRYEYERRKAADSTRANANAVFLSLSYAWPTEVPGVSQ